MNVQVITLSVVFMVLISGVISNGKTKSDVKCPNDKEPRDCSDTAFVCNFVRCEASPFSRCSLDGCDDCNIIFKPFLSPISFTLKDCEIAKPDKRCNKGSDKNSECGGFRRFFVKDECKSSMDCAFEKMCCKEGCKHVCVDEVVETQGVCPPISGHYCKVSSCDEDVDCSYGEKCCPNVCGKSCEQPVPKNTKKCEDGSIEYICSTDPCTYQSCQAFPTATCKANKCGGCNADFMDSKENQVDCEFLGPNCSTCFVNPCSIVRCKDIPEAECRPEWCPNCQAKFYKDDKEVDCKEICPYCDVDPCEGRKCNGKPNAKCKSDLCQCTYQFVDDKDATVDC